MSNDRHSYVVVGSGAAGAVVANRLSANPANRVLLLEAGSWDWNPLFHIPAGLTQLITTHANWGSPLTPQRETEQPRDLVPARSCARRLDFDQYHDLCRGHRLDYDHWRELGNEGWGYEDVLPYFRRSENNERFNDRYHGCGGDLNVTGQVQANPLSKAFVRAFQEPGLPV